MTSVLYVLAVAGLVTCLACHPRSCPADNCWPSPWPACELQTWGSQTYLVPTGSKADRVPNTFGFTAMIGNQANLMTVQVHGWVHRLRVDAVNCRVSEVR